MPSNTPRTVNWPSAVNELANQTPVAAETVNPLLSPLIQRTQWLYEQLMLLSGKSAMTAINQPVAQGEIVSVGDIVYWKQVPAGRSGVAKAKADFASDAIPYVYGYAPLASAFAIGIVRGTNGQTADVYIGGLVEDQAINLANMVDGTVPSSMVVDYGAYYLSRTEPGKLTRDPGNVPVFVGTAAGTGKFYLNISIKELLSLYEHYRFKLLDRPAGTPALVNGAWTITNADPAKVGWYPCALDPSSPAGAKFRYNIPADHIAPDLTIPHEDWRQAVELANALPPEPKNWSTMAINGVLQGYFGESAGVYSVEASGIYWYRDIDGQQPWASDLVSGPGIGAAWTPANWHSASGSTPVWRGDERNRPRQEFYFAKFNPNLRSTLVTSLEPAPGAAVEIVRAGEPTIPAKTGDLWIKFGIGLNQEDEVTPSGKVVTEIKDTDSGIVVVNGRAITGINAGLGIDAIEDDRGRVTIAYNASGLNGDILQIEPHETSLKFTGLTSYFELPNPAVLVTGMRCKFVLPQVVPGNTGLKIKAQLFGVSSTVVPQIAPFTLSYQVTNNDGSVVYGLGLAPAISVAPNPKVTFNNYTAWTTKTAWFTPTGDDTSSTIPGGVANLPPNAVVNFSLFRAAAGNTYTSNIGIIRLYWSF